MREALRKIVFICMPSNSLHAAQMSILALEGGGWLSFVHLLILRHDLIYLIYLIVWLCTPMLCEPLKVQSPRVKERVTPKGDS